MDNYGKNCCRIDKIVAELIKSKIYTCFLFDIDIENILLKILAHIDER